MAIIDPTTFPKPPREVPAVLKRFLRNQWEAAVVKGVYSLAIIIGLSLIAMSLMAHGPVPLVKRILLAVGMAIITALAVGGLLYLTARYGDSRTLKVYRLGELIKAKIVRALLTWSYQSITLEYSYNGKGYKGLAAYEGGPQMEEGNEAWILVLPQNPKHIFILGPAIET